MKNRLLLITLLFLSLAPLSDASQKGIWPFRKKAKAAVEQKDTTRKEDKYEKFFRKESKKQEGFLTVHLKEGKVYFEIDDSLLGRDLVMGTTIRSISDNENGVVGAKNELTSITFTKADSTIQLRELSYDCLPDTRLMQEALSRSHTGTILANMPIVQRGPDSTYVFDMVLPLRTRKIQPIPRHLRQQVDVQCQGELQEEPFLHRGCQGVRGQCIGDHEPVVHIFDDRHRRP